MIKLKIANEAQFQQALSRYAEGLVMKVAEALFDAGVEIIKEARQNADFQNWTNNLRSSFGVAVAINGNIIKDNFERRGDGKDGDGLQGLGKAKELVKGLCAQYPDKVVMIAVAAENYAGYVESKNRNVLTAYAYGLRKEIKIKLQQ